MRSEHVREASSGKVALWTNLDAQARLASSLVVMGIALQLEAHVVPMAITPELAIFAARMAQVTLLQMGRRAVQTACTTRPRMNTAAQTTDPVGRERLALDVHLLAARLGMGQSRLHRHQQQQLHTRPHP